MEILLLRKYIKHAFIKDIKYIKDIKKYKTQAYNAPKIGWDFS